MIPRLGDGNQLTYGNYAKFIQGLENDSPSRGRKQYTLQYTINELQ